MFQDQSWRVTVWECNQSGRRNSLVKVILGAGMPFTVVCQCYIYGYTITFSWWIEGIKLYLINQLNWFDM